MYLRNLFLLLLLIGLTSAASAQSKAAGKANKLYKEKQFAAAIPEFETAIGETPSYGLRSKLAFCYKVTNKLEKAEKLYSVLVYDDKVKDISFKYYAETLIGGGKYAAAKFWLDEYIKKKPDDKQAKVLMQTCDLVYTIKPQFPETAVEKFEFNSELDDNAACLINNRLYFSSDRGGKGKTDVEGRGFMLIYESEKMGDSWATPSKAGGKVNTVNSNSGPISFNGDGTYAIYAKNAPVANKKGQYALQIYGSEIEDGKIKGADRLPFCKLESNYFQAAISADGNMIVFSTDKGGGEGKADLYSAKKTGDKWSMPKNLGAAVNSSESEGFPFLSADNTLYFCSKGYLGFGGYDIYKSTQNSSGIWTEPVNLGFPINSSGDEMSFFINTDNKSGIISSTRGSGNDDIYFFNPAASSSATIAVVEEKEEQTPPDFAKAAIAKREAEEAQMKQDKIDRLAAEAEAKRIEKIQAEEKALADAKAEKEAAALLALQAKEKENKVEAPLVDVEVPTITKSEGLNTINEKSTENINQSNGDTLYVGKRMDEPDVVKVAEQKVKKAKKKKKKKEVEVVTAEASKRVLDKPIAVSTSSKKIEQIEEVRNVSDKDVNIPTPDPVMTKVPNSTTPKIETPAASTASVEKPKMEKIELPASNVPAKEEVVLDVKKMETEKMAAIDKKSKKKSGKKKSKKLDKISDVNTSVKEPKINVPSVSKAPIDKAATIAKGQKSKFENMQALASIQSDIRSNTTANKKYTLADLKYGFNATAVSGDLVEPLNDLANLLKEEGTIKVKLIGHTGSIGSDEKNQRLSVARAAAAVDYLISKGIDPNRLSFDGKGETEIMNGCHDGVLCGKAQHQENERIELVVQ